MVTVLYAVTVPIAEMYCFKSPSFAGTAATGTIVCDTPGGACVEESGPLRAIKK